MGNVAEFPIQPVKPVKYEIEKTYSGTWRRYESPAGERFAEFQSESEIGGRPLVTIAWGIDPETGKMAIADGFIGIGQRARGFIAIGQFVNGTFALGQFATGRVAALGQFVIAPLAIGQFSIAVATVAQMGLAGWGIFQFGATAFDGVGQFLLRALV